MSWKSDRVTWGVTVSTPKFDALGSASTSYETFLAGVDTTGNGSTDDIYIINNQGDLDSQDKSPWSIAFGTGIRVGKRSLIHATAQYFAGIPQYTILQSQPFIGQSTGEELQMTVVDKLSPVLNYGLGLEIFINEHVSLFGSFATDFAAVESDVNRISELSNSINDNTFKADIYHFGFGTDIKTKLADLTIGAMYATSSETVKRSFTLDDGQDPVTSDAEIIYSRWRFLIGFEFHFADKVKEKLNLEN